MKFSSDIDIDVANRSDIIEHIDVTPASIIRDGKLAKHASGVYVTDVPVDPFSGQCSLDYKAAEERGYIKLDLLNVGLYQRVIDERHLLELMAAEPKWEMLRDREFFEKLIHVGEHYDTMCKMPEPINSITRMAMFLAIIRPAKRNLIGLSWAEVAKTIWDIPTDGGYYFKKSHSISYAHLVVVNMNLNSSN